MVSPAIFESHSNFSFDMPSGKMAIDSQASKAESICAAPAIIAGRGPDCFLSCRVELAGNEARHETAKRGTDFVRAGREPFADQHNDACGNSRQRRRKLEVVDSAKCPARSDRFIMPVDSEQVTRIHIPEFRFSSIAP